jgi:peptide/nickel transport system substrate-binding protein
MLMTKGPRSFDPALDDSTEGAEVNWLVYTGLTSYARAAGSAGTQLIAGLSTALPAITDNGRRFSFTLRKGLVYPTGAPVLARDFAHTVERAIKLKWPGAAAFLVPLIVGARQYADGTANTISGITTDDATGTIVIQLRRPYPAFVNVLAFPALGLVPSNVPFKPESTSPPPGVGPYEATNIVPGRSFSVVQNPRWPSFNVPGIPAGSMNVNVRIARNAGDDALAVLQNRADVFDWVDRIPAAVIVQIESGARDRFKQVDPASVSAYVFRAGSQPPFDTTFAREAVIATQRNVAAAVGAVKSTAASPAGEFTEFASGRLNFGSMIFSPVYGWDLSSFQLQ